MCICLFESLALSTCDVRFLLEQWSNIWPDALPDAIDKSDWSVILAIAPYLHASVLSNSLMCCACRHV